MKARIDPERCSSVACQKCEARKVCEIKALSQIERGEVALVQENLCNGCGVCITKCPVGAISLE